MDRQNTAVPRNARSPLIALGVLGIAFALLLGAGARADARTLTVGRTTIGQAIPSGFVGLSMEFKDFEAYAGHDPKAIDPAFLHLLQNLAPDQPPVLRIGGDSSDWTWWPVPHMSRPAGVRYDLTPTWMRVARAAARDVHARLILGINFEADSTRIAAAEARAMVNRIGRPSIDALELGNEPELYGSYPWYKAANGTRVYGRPRGWADAQFNSDFGRIARALPTLSLAGPSIGSQNWLTSDLGPFLSSETHVKLTTIHAYPLKHCTPSNVVTAAQLLAESSSTGFARGVAPFAALAHRRATRIRVDEMNAISCGGFRGVSDTFASSLWVLDALFELAKIGVDGVNIHTVPGTINEVLGPSFAHGRWSVRVHPEYYGMMMFAQAAPAGSRLLRLSSTPPPDVRVFATQATNGTVRIALINDRLSGPQTIRLRIPSPGGPAVVEQLRSPSVHATTRVSLGGQTFGDATTTGVLAGAQTPVELGAVRGVYAVRLPAASATLLTLSAAKTALAAH